MMPHQCKSLQASAEILPIPVIKCEPCPTTLKWPSPDTLSGLITLLLYALSNFEVTQHYK